MWRFSISKLPVQDPPKNGHTVDGNLVPVDMVNIPFTGAYIPRRWRISSINSICSSVGPFCWFLLGPQWYRRRNNHPRLQWSWRLCPLWPVGGSNSRMWYRSWFLDTIHPLSTGWIVLNLQISLNIKLIKHVQNLDPNPIYFLVWWFMMWLLKKNSPIPIAPFPFPHRN